MRPRRTVNNRASSCIDEPCPICFCNYYQDESSSGYFPVFQRCCLKAICYKCIVRYIKNQSSALICPLCRADIEVDITRRAPIIPIPEEIPEKIRALVESHIHRARLTESVVNAIYRLREQGALRIAFLPDSSDLKEDIEQALEFIMTMFVMRGLSDIQMIFESGFGCPLPDLSGFLCFNDYIMLPKCQKFVYVAG
jgi:hypothetical protein